MARYRRRATARREWLTPARYAGSNLAQTGSLADWGVTEGFLGYDQVGDLGTKIHANGLISVQSALDPGDPPGSTIAYHPMGPYTIERIVGQCIIWTNDQDAVPQPVGAFLLAVFPSGNPYGFSGSDPTWDNLRVKPGVMHMCASGVTAANSGPSVTTQHIDVRTKRIVNPDTSFYIILRSLTTVPGDEQIYFQTNLKVLVRYPS